MVVPALLMLNIIMGKYRDDTSRTSVPTSRSTYMHSGACARSRTRTGGPVLVLTRPGLSRLAVPGTPALGTGARGVELASTCAGSASGGPGLGARAGVVLGDWVCGTSRSGLVGASVL